MKRFITYLLLAVIAFSGCNEVYIGYTEAEMISIPVESFEIDGNGGDITIKVNAHCSWEITIKDSWLNTSIKKGDKGLTSFSVIVDENKAVKERSTTISISNKSIGIFRSITINQNSGAPFVNCNEKELDFTAAASSKSIELESNIDYTISSSQSWCKIDKNKGTSGKLALNISVEASPTVEKRSAKITFANTEHNYRSDITISQEAFVPKMEISQDEITTLDIGETKSVTISSNISWEATCDANWITLSPTSKEKGENKLSITTATNTTTSSRSAIIKVSCHEYRITNEIKVTQNEFVPSLTIDINSISAAVNGGEKLVKVSSNMTWKATCSEDWISLSPTNGKEGTNSVKITIATNTTTITRTAKIYITNGEYNVTREISVLQAEFVPELEVSTNSISTDVAGESKIVTILSNISWSANCNASWITITPTSGTKGSSTINVNIAENTATSTRSAKVYITNSEYNITREIYISQDEFIPELIVSSSILTANVAGKTKTVTINSNIPWNATCDADWITLSSSSGTRGTSTIDITITANVKTTTRTTTVKIYNNEYNTTKDIQITQEEFIPEITLSTNSISMDGAGDSTSITINSNISWEANCNAKWITLSQTSGEKGETILVITTDIGSTETSRSTIVSLSNLEYNITRDISLSQAQFHPTLTIDTLSIESSADKEVKTIAINSNMPWVAVCDANWITLSPANGTKVSSALDISIAANLVASPRSAIVTVANVDYNITREIQVTQAAWSPYITIGTSSISASATGETRSITIKSNISWNATSSASWVSVSNSNGSSNTKTLNLYIADNSKTTSRSATITITNTAYNISKVINIYQSAFTPYIEISYSDIVMHLGGGRTSVTITSNIPWNASRGDSYSNGWVSISPSSGTSGTTTLKINVSPLSDSNGYRSAEIEVYNSSYGISKSIRVRQHYYDIY